MAEQWRRETPDRREEVRVVRQDGYEQRHEVIDNIGIARYEALTKVTSLIWLMFGILISLIGLRVALRLIAANPENPFASLVYSFTDLFLWPFHNLTATPAADGMVLEISSIIAMFVYAILAWIIIRVIWLVFHRTPTRTITTHERDRL